MKLALVFALLLGAKERGILIGKWRTVDKPVTVEFMANGKLTVKKGDGQLVRGTYKWIDDTHMSVDIRYDPKRPFVDTLKVFLMENRLDTTDSKGNVDRLERIRE
jgi:hypothetical protein